MIITTTTTNSSSSNRSRRSCYSNLFPIKKQKRTILVLILLSMILILFIFSKSLIYSLRLSQQETGILIVSDSPLGVNVNVDAPDTAAVAVVNPIDNDDNKDTTTKTITTTTATPNYETATPNSLQSIPSEPEPELESALASTSTSESASALASPPETVLPLPLPPVYPSISLENCTLIRTSNTTNPTLLQDYHESLKAYPQTSTVPWPDVPTMSYYWRSFYSGFRNQMMCFTVLIMATIQHEGPPGGEYELQRSKQDQNDNDTNTAIPSFRYYGQFLLETIQQKDTYGSNKKIPFEMLWDIEHWNSYYPKLPRLVHWDPVVHDHYDKHDKNNNGWMRKDINGTNTFVSLDDTILPNGPYRPLPYGVKQNQLMGAYMRYAKGKGPYTNNGHRNDIEILMLREALRPHPGLRLLIEEKLAMLVNDHDNNNNDDDDNNTTTTTITTTTTTTKLEYITLHARVEPDMQRQQVCVPKKVLNLTDIFQMLENKWKDPPAPHLFLPINREYLEKEGDIDNDPKLQKQYQQDPSKINWIAVENLKALNQVTSRKTGKTTTNSNNDSSSSSSLLWGGRVKVFEFGAKMLQGTQWEHRPSTTGALLNFFIAIDAKIFIGTEVSSYSHDLLATRFYKNSMENYKYLPEGLVEWTPQGIQDPPGFEC